MPTKQALHDEFAKLESPLGKPMNPPGGESGADLERTLEETKRNIAQQKVEAYIREHAGEIGVPEGIVVTVQSPGGGGGEGLEPSA